MRPSLGSPNSLHKPLGRSGGRGAYTQNLWRLWTARFPRKLPRFVFINHFPWIFSTSLVLPQASCRVRLSTRDENQRPQEAPPLPPRAWGLSVSTRQGCHPAGSVSCLAAHRQMAGRGLGSDTTCEPRGARRRRGTCPLPEALPRTVPDAPSLLPGDLMLRAERPRLKLLFASIPTQKGTRFRALTRTRLRSSCHVTVGR